MTRVLSVGVVWLSMSISVLLSRLFTISFGFVLVSFAASTKNYEVGSLYTYDYILGLELNEPNAETPSSEVKTGSTVGYKILSQVQVRSVWQNEPGGSILEIQLVKPQLQIKSRKAPQPEGFRDHSSQLDAATLHPLYVHWKDGQVQNTFTVEDDDLSLVNIKKGIANILQYHTTTGDITENTTRGKCEVSYTLQNNRQTTKTITGKCDTSDASVPLPLRTHNSRVLGSEIDSEIRAELTLTREGSVVEDAEVTETHVVRVTSKKEVGANVKGTQSFKLSGTSTSKDKVVKATTAEAAIKEIAKTKGFQLTPESLVPKPENIPTCEAPNCKTFDVLTRVLTSDNMATSKMASAFIQLVQKFREASFEELKNIVKPNLRIYSQLLDVCAAAGTPDTHRVAMSTLKFNLEEEIDNPERYLLGLSLSPSPSKGILDELYALVKRKVPSEKLQETLTLTTAALVNTLRKNSGGDSSIGSEVEEYLTNSLTSCSGEQVSECQQLYLRSLKNLKSKKTVPALFEIVQTAEQKVSLVAIKTIHAMPDSFINAKYRPILIKIVQQLGRKYDSSVRTLALDLILRNSPTKEEIQELFQLLEKVSDSQHAEVATFLWNRAQEFMETNPQLQAYLSDIIIENNFKTYHHLSPRGLSTSFTRIFTESPSGNSSFSNAIEMSGKILKRSCFDVNIRSKDDSLQLLSLGIFAGGLSSFTSNSDDETESQADAEEATAGMELTLMGVQTRPIVFFVGKGELMSLVWSGAGSERTTALQGNVLLQDERRAIPLFNGIVADVSIQGGLSFDLAGQVQLSLWHRTANSLVENRAGLFLQSVVRADTSFVRSRVDYTVATESALHFTSDINFYDGVLMCLKLTQPEFNIRQNIHKTERIPGSKHKLRKAKYKTTPVTGITYALNKKNSELCGVMYKDEL